MIMKQLLGIFAMTALTLTSCSPKVSTTLVEGSETGFSLDFFQKAIQRADKDENITVSPYSAGVALSMLASGAEGSTLEELDQALNHCRFINDDLGSNDSVTICSANALWINKLYPPKRTYVDALKKDFDALSQALDFSSPSALDAINSWCSENTNGRIPKALDELDADMVAVLSNALYFKGLWHYPFNPDLTRKDAFKGSKKTSYVDFMELKQKLQYADIQGNQIVRLPYASGRYAMTILLPGASVDADSFIKYISEENYDELLSSMIEQDVVLRLPKFKVENSLRLNSVLRDMGVNKVFTRSAELGRMTDADVMVSDVNQKTFVEINEQGAEAAAVTTIAVKLTAVRPMEQTFHMTVDRPFYYMISDIDNGRILFIGRIMNL